MQKFVVKRTHTFSSEFHLNPGSPVLESHCSMNGSGSHVRLSGYLKKKRIVRNFSSFVRNYDFFFVLIQNLQKVGGWKKLWFVLQNQLLLSYTSKEDYEERLAPFKDVISLVPGTQILPMHQNRFTIETSGKVLYIFVSFNRFLSSLPIFH